VNILSQWKFTLDPAGTPVVILDFDWELLEEPTFTLQRGLEIVPIPDGVPLLRPTKADVYNFVLPIVRVSESDAYARRDMINQFTDRYDDLGVVALRWEVDGLTDRYYQFSSAFFHTPSVRRLPDNIDGSWLLSLPITAVGCTKTIL
jgi:hypothetical protein